MVCVGVVFGVPSQLSNLWRNDSGSTGKQKMFEQDFVFFFVYAQNVINVFWKLTLRHVLMESLELNLFCTNIAFVLNNKCK